MEYFQGYIYLDNLIDFDVITHNGVECAVFPLTTNGCVRKRRNLVLPFNAYHNVVAKYNATMDIKTILSDEMKEKLMLKYNLVIGKLYRKETKKY